MRARGMWVAALAMVFVSPVHASTRFELGLGMTGASSDGPKKSGAALTAAVMWELIPALEFGAMLYADDLGARIGRLRDPNDGTDLGAVGEDHRNVFGVAWRADLPLVRGERWRSEVGATWGYYRVQDDRVGNVQRAVSSTGWSIGVGGSRRLRPTTAMGVSVRWQVLPDKRQDYYVRATVDLMWLPFAAADARTPPQATPGNEN